MKQLLVLLFFVPLFSKAQECNLNKVVDKFSQQPKYTTGLVTFQSGKGTFQLSIDVNATEIDLMFSLANAGDNKCFDDQSTATATFENGRTRLFLRNSGTMNCDGYFHLTYRNTPMVNYNLQRLGNMKVASIKFVSGKNTTEVTLDDQGKQTLQTMVNCIIKQAPMLIKQ
jgi:hypothetical protein